MNMKDTLVIPQKKDYTHCILKERTHIQALNTMLLRQLRTLRKIVFMDHKMNINNTMIMPKK